MIVKCSRIVFIFLISTVSFLQVKGQDDKTYTVEITENDLSKIRNLTIGYGWGINAGNDMHTSLDNMHSFLVNYRLDRFGSVSFQSHFYLYDDDYPEAVNNSESFFGTHDLVFTYGVGNKEVFKKTAMKIDPISSVPSDIETNKIIINELRFGYLFKRDLLYSNNEYYDEGSIFGLSNVIQVGWQLGLIDDIEYNLQLVESFMSTLSWIKPRPFNRKLSKIWYFDLFYGVGLGFTEASVERYIERNGFEPRTEKVPLGGRIGFRRHGLRNMHFGWTFEIGSIPQQALLDSYVLQGLYVRAGLYLPLVSVRVPTPKKFQFISQK